MSTETEVEQDYRELPELSVGLDHDYERWKAFEVAKDADKARFYELANDELAEEPAEKLVSANTYGETDQQVMKRIERHNPGWKIDAQRILTTDEARELGYTYEFILVEDTTLKAFTYVNTETGRTFQRTSRKGSVLIDDEFMKLVDPDLYEEVTFELPWGERITRPLKMLSAEQTARCAKFIYRGKPSVSLAPPRDATLEELE